MAVRVSRELVGMFYHVFKQSTRTHKGTLQRMKQFPTRVKSYNLGHGTRNKIDDGCLRHVLTCRINKSHNANT